MGTSGASGGNVTGGATFADSGRYKNIMKQYISY